MLLAPVHFTENARHREGALHARLVVESVLHRLAIEERPVDHRGQREQDLTIALGSLIIQERQKIDTHTSYIYRVRENNRLAHAISLFPNSLLLTAKNLRVASSICAIWDDTM